MTDQARPVIHRIVYPSSGAWPCFPTLPLLEVMFPNSVKKALRNLLIKVKKKVLLLQNRAGTDHSLIGRTHLSGKSTWSISPMWSLSLKGIGPHFWSQLLPVLAIYCLGLGQGYCSVREWFLKVPADRGLADILQLSERVITHGSLACQRRSWHTQRNDDKQTVWD
jgi:hypothetical protein